MLQDIVSIALTLIVDKYSVYGSPQLVVVFGGCHSFITSSWPSLYR